MSPLGRAAPRLASVFRASPVPFVLMLDDFHELQSPACHDVMGVVISGIPRNSQLVAASRSEQPHLPRLRASGDALEFAASDLALDATGAEQIFAAAELTVTPEFAAAVTERTEGWPVGLYLAALIAKDNDGEALVAGDDRYVADYLYREALIRLPESHAAVPAANGSAGPPLGSDLRRVAGRSRWRRAAAEARGVQHVLGTARPATRLVPLPRTVP